MQASDKKKPLAHDETRYAIIGGNFENEEIVFKDLKTKELHTGTLESLFNTALYLQFNKVDIMRLALAYGQLTATFFLPKILPHDD